MKDKRRKLKEVTNIPKHPDRHEQVEKGYVVSDAELVICDDVITESDDMLFSDYQMDIIFEEQT